MSSYQEILDFIKSRFPDKEFIPLHEPLFIGNERKYVIDAIDSTFVSSVGAYVNRFEEMIAKEAGTKFAVATVNGTAALHIALKMSGVNAGDMVISQALTFIATANAISYLGANPVFLDVDVDTMGLSPQALEEYFSEHCECKKEGTYDKETGNRIAACVPMHTFGLSSRIDDISSICKKWNVPLVEDAAESIGSLYQGKPTGSFGDIGAISFNGNKTLTCGGGGAVVTNDEKVAKLAKHITTQAKTPHKWEFNHDMIGYNYRMPNLNAAMACAQIEMLDDFIDEKRQLAQEYNAFFEDKNILHKEELEGTRSNYWLNAIEFPNLEERNLFLDFTNANGVMTRPIWNLMTELEMFKHCKRDHLKNSYYLKDRIVNIPSSVRK